MNDIDRLRGFLLGNLSDRERDAVEKSVLADDALFELLLAVEEELVDESVRGLLGRDEAKRFLGYLMRTPGGAERLELARALEVSLGASPPGGHARQARRAGWHATALARAAVVAILLGGGLLAAVILGFRAQLRQLRGEAAKVEAEAKELQGQLAEARAENDKLVSERDRLRTAQETPPGRFAIPVLSAGILRSGGTIPTISLPREEPILALSLDLAADSHETYRAVLRDVDAREWIALSQLTARAEASKIRVVLAIPAAGLQPGDYFVSLSGISDSGEPEPIARYDFRIRRQ